MDPSAPASMHTTGAPHEAHGTAWLADCKRNGRPHEHSSRSYRHMSPAPRTAHPAHGSGEVWGSGCGSRPGFGCKLSINILPKGMEHPLPQNSPEPCGEPGCSVGLMGCTGRVQTCGSARVHENTATHTNWWCNVSFQCYEHHKNRLSRLRSVSHGLRELHAFG
jgi:hypothetical protein